MSAAKKGLGRGFESLIPTDLIDDSFNPNSSFDTTAAEDKKVSEQAKLPISKIRANVDQPRKSFDVDALQELAESIKVHGVLQPIIVTPRGDDYQIVAGERRYRASRLAGLNEIPVVIRTMTDQHQLEISVIENIQRRDLNAIETATSYAKLRDQFNLNAEEIAKRVNKSPSSIINTMRLLRLPKVAIDLLAGGKLSEGQARPLIGQDPELVAEIAPRIVEESWSARKVEQYMASIKRAIKDEAQAPAGTAVDAAALEQQQAQRVEALRERLNAKVDIRTNNKGAGKITIGFKDAEDFQRIQDLLSK